MTNKYNIDGLGDYEIDSWLEQLGSKPIERIAYYDGSACYEMDRIHILRLENHHFAIVTESGCSCYDSSQAKIDLQPTEELALNKFDSWMRRYKEEVNRKYD